jgi:hypothetical protein
MIHHFQIRGRRVVWKYARLRGRADGWSITPDERLPDGERKVLISDKLRGRARLETEVHEALHQLFPDLSEETVTNAGRDIARILWSLQYRITQEETG